jgi:beta-glucosidase/6-phospho-beta-glucosidase/beta-galactosidase
VLSLRSDHLCRSSLERVFRRYAARFGLIAVDRTTFVRTPKRSLAWLGEVARRNELS